MLYCEIAETHEKVINQFCYYLLRRKLPFEVKHDHLIVQFAIHGDKRTSDIVSNYLTGLYQLLED